MALEGWAIGRTQYRGLVRCDPLSGTRDLPPNGIDNRLPCSRNPTQRLCRIVQIPQRISHGVNFLEAASTRPQQLRFCKPRLVSAFLAPCPVPRASRLERR